MEQGLKERLVGAAVIVILAVIFIPMLLDNTEKKDIVITKTNIPPRPESIPEPPDENEFSSRIVPLEQEAPVTGKVQAAIESIPDDSVVEEPETGTEKGPDSGEAETANINTNEEPANGVGLSAWVVQLGSFSSQENADSLNRRLQTAGFRAFVEPLKKDNDVSYRVRVGPELKRSDAEAIQEKLKKTMQLEGFIVQYP